MNIYDLLENYGFFNFIGPFFIAFSLVYGSLRKIGLFEKVRGSEKIYVFIAFAIAFYYLYNIAIIEYTQKVLSFFFYEILIIFFIILILGFLFEFVTAKDAGTAKKNILVGISSLLVFFSFIYASFISGGEIGEASANITKSVTSILIDSGLLVAILPIIILIIVIAWMISPTPGRGVKETTKRILSTTDATIEDILRRLKGGQQEGQERRQ